MRPTALAVAFLVIAKTAYSDSGISPSNTTRGGDAEQGCASTVSPLSLSVPGSGGTGEVSVTTAAGCSWTASSESAWLSVQTNGGTGNGTVTWIAVANPLPSQRIGFLSVAGRSIFVAQLQPTVPIPPVPPPPAPPPIPTTPPGAPRQLGATVSGSSVTLNWSEPDMGGAPTTYVLAVGSAAGWSNLGSFPTGSTYTSFSASSVPNGVYFARVSAQNATGMGPASNEVSFSVPQACGSVPDAPAALQSSVSGLIVTLTWAAPSAGAVPTAYSIEAGSDPGRADLALVNTESPATTFTAHAAPGTYFVRVRAVTACGASAASREVVVVVR